MNEHRVIRVHRFVVVGDHRIDLRYEDLDSAHLVATDEHGRPSAGIAAFAVLDLYGWAVKRSGLRKPVTRFDGLPPRRARMAVAAHLNHLISNPT